MKKILSKKNLRNLFVLSLSSSSIYAQELNEIKTRLIIDNIICRGNDNTQCEFITKKYYQSVGDLVNPDEIQDAKLRLGTLHQFKNVSIFLEKANKRGHVKVIFSVDEAENIQYNFYAGYSGTESNDTFNQSVGLTNFNFLGSGKRLNFNINGFQSRTTDSDVMLNGLTSDLNTQFDTYIANLAYYDPHLMDSVHYYISSSIAHYSISSTVDSEVIKGEGGRINSLNNSYSLYNLSIGRRFARYSYISVDMSGGNNNDGYASISYGWDSSGDNLFVLEGSAFHSSLYTDLNGNHTFLSLSYSQNFILNEDYQFTYGVSDNFHLNGSSDLTEEFNPYLYLNLNDIDSSHRVTGKYTGWGYYLRSPLRDINSSDIGIGLSYTYQTNQLNMILSLDYYGAFGEQK